MASDCGHTPPPALVTGGGLVVQDGPGAGTSFPFHYPVTLVGRSGGCDIRLEAGDVRSLHCLLTPGTDGVNLRALARDAVRVNGRPTSSANLQDGDLIEIGPCRLRVRWPVSDTGADDPLFESLRIQAAAVVAQQAELTEWEITLTDRASALTRQESELASHLDNQRRQLLDLQDQIAQARASLRDKRAAFATLSAEQEVELATVRQEAYDRRAAVERRETRMARLWAKFRNRVRDNAQTERARAAVVAVRQQADRAELEAQRQCFDDFRRQFHTSAELEKRAIVEGWDRVRTAEAEDRELRVRLNQQVHDLAFREKALVAGEKRLAADRHGADLIQESLRLEVGRLEARATAARQVLAERQRETEQLGGVLATIAAGAPAALPLCPAPHEGDLADQRLILAEQVQRFAAARLAWDADRVRALADLDVLFELHADRERELGRREVELAEAEAEAAEDRDTLARLTLRLEADRLRAEGDVAALRAAAESDFAAAESRLQAAKRREDTLCELYQLWGRRRSTEIAQLRQARAAADAERESWAALRDAWLRGRARLLRDQQDVATRQLALEKYRQECIEAAERPALAERRLERLRKQWLAWTAGHGRELNRLAATLAVESESLDARTTHCRRDEAALQLRACGLAELAADADRAQLEATALRASCQEQLAAAQRDVAQSVQAIERAHDQFERLARTLIHASDSSHARAA